MTINTSGDLILSFFFWQYRERERKTLNPRQSNGCRKNPVRKEQGGKKKVMEFVPFTTEQLSYLTKPDPCPAPIFVGVFASDQLPGLPELWKKRAYIVNTNPIDKPGSHWLAIFTKKHT